jgi:hypothetical protein
LAANRGSRELATAPKISKIKKSPLVSEPNSPDLFAENLQIMAQSNNIQDFDFYIDTLQKNDWKSRQQGFTKIKELLELYQDQNLSIT